nr:MAG TPA: hypothetical protein [Caudoviricetes sp.]
MFYKSGRKYGLIFLPKFMKGEKVNGHKVFY